MTITQITYEEDRFLFFSEQKRLAEKRYKRLAKLVKPDDSYLSETRQLASEAGRELSFYNDVVEMLMIKLSEQKQVSDFMQKEW